MQLFTILLMTPAEGGGGLSSMMLMMGMIFAVMYFFMIRPQSKRAKEQKNFLIEIKKGDKIITAGGIHGKILSVDDHTILLEVDSNTKIRIEKSVISVEMSKQLKKV